MLAIFRRELVNPPQELNSPTSSSRRKLSLPQEILTDFASSNPSKAFSMGFGGQALLAYLPASNSLQQRLFVGANDVYCLFLGNMRNLHSLNKQYGLSKCSNEAMFLIEAYRTLRDRGPYPAHQVIKSLDGCFAFVIYDTLADHVFIALGEDERVGLFWGIAEDGSVVISEDGNTVKRSCGKSYAPFPRGFMFHSEQGLTSFEHPNNEVRAMPRVDSEGVMCGANFMADAQTRIAAMPRVGSEANWALWNHS